VGRVEAESAGKNDRIEAEVDIYRKDSAICNIYEGKLFLRSFRVLGWQYF